MARNQPKLDSENLLLLTDSYKVTHHYQYPPNTTLVYSYFESRGGQFSNIVFFGLQYIIKKWLVGEVVTEQKIAEAKDILGKHFNNESLVNEEGWRYIVQKHKGCLPIRIKAVPEGTIVPVKNVMFTVENTDPKCFWLTNYLETLLVEVWYPMTVATISRSMKVDIATHLKATADNMSMLPFKLHDFGFRGATCAEAAGIGGCAHLVNFVGTDTLAALVVARNYYNSSCAGYSIPAAEHSTMTSWGPDREKEAYKNMIDTFKTGPVAVVSDSYDIYNACSNIWGKDLKDDIKKRKAPLVVRPDSGEPKEIVPKVLNLLGEAFGSSKNSKDYKMLPDYIRVIQGDGIGVESIKGILDAIQKAGWSTDNVTFGCGGGLLQKFNRDTQKCAMKCSYMEAQENNQTKTRDVYKNPVTDKGKESKKGRLTLEKLNGQYTTMQRGEGDASKDELVLVYENGKILRDQTLDEIRKRAEVRIESL